MWVCELLLLLTKLMLDFLSLFSKVFKYIFSTLVEHYFIYLQFHLVLTLLILFKSINMFDISMLTALNVCISNYNTNLFTCISSIELQQSDKLPTFQVVGLVDLT